MKLKIITIALILIQLPGYCNYILNSVFFTNGSTGYAVGADGALNSNLILKTTNGGAGWAIKSSGDSSYLYSVYFKDENNGYAVGEDLTSGGGIIYKTTDAGNTWTKQMTEQGNSLISVYFPTLDKGYIAGVDYFHGSVIKKTTDGGITWFSQSTGTNSWLWSIYFVNSDTGYASGANGTIIKTTNGGVVWETLQSGTNKFLRAIWFTTASTGYAVGESGIILKTTDSGDSWQNIPSGTTSFLRSIYFSDTSTGFIVGNVGRILKTTDYGTTWNIILSGTNEDLKSVNFPNKFDGYVIGIQDSLLKTTNEGNNWSSKVIKAIQVLSPNGGENWYNGSTYIIKWHKYLVENIKIEFSMNNGLTWTTLVISHFNYDQYYWTINSTGSEECLVRISDADDSNTVDISDETFTIVPVGITVTSPNGGEVWLNGSTQEILWTSENLGTVYLRIRLSLDNGQNWTSIVNGTANTGVYSWIVNSSSASEECLIKVESLNHTFSDNSDSAFAIEILPEVKGESENEVPVKYSLHQNYPNPFNPTTTIKYTIPSVIASGAKQSPFVTLKVYDILGNEVATLVNEERQPGVYEVEFNPESNIKYPASGVYFYKLIAGEFTQTRKMILLR